MSNYEQAFSGKDVLITGGLGFIGSNLAVKLAGLGASVTLVDAMIAGYGGNLFNIRPIEDRVRINFSDITDVNSMNYLVRGRDYIFHCAGQVCHIMSLTNPFPDIDFNIKGTAILLEACRKFNKDAKIVKMGTRGQYGPAVKLPVDEEAPTHPKGIYEISHLTAEQIMKVYNDIHGIRSVLLRLSNTYGPRSQMQHSRFGVVNWFIRQAIDGETIKIFGDGKLLRDFLYIEDCVEAILASSTEEGAVGEILNVGIDKPTSFLELVETIIGICGSGRWEFSPFSEERKAQEPGHYYSDIRKIKRVAGWQPRIALPEGLKETIAYYKKFKALYW